MSNTCKEESPDLNQINNDRLEYINKLTSDYNMRVNTLNRLVNSGGNTNEINIQKEEITKILNQLSDKNIDTINTVKNLNNEVTQKNSTSKTLGNNLKKYQHDIDKGKKNKAILEQRLEDSKKKSDNIALEYTIYLSAIIILVIIQVLMFVFIPEPQC